VPNDILACLKLWWDCEGVDVVRSVEKIGGCPFSSRILSRLVYFKPYGPEGIGRVVECFIVTKRGTAHDFAGLHFVISEGARAMYVIIGPLWLSGHVVQFSLTWAPAATVPKTGAGAVA
jgi:hypothetical protein